MSKNFYFGATIAFLSFIYIINSIGVELKSLVTIGMGFLFVMAGMILNELYENRKNTEQFQQMVTEMLKLIELESKINSNINEMKGRSEQLKCYFDMLGKIAEISEKEKAPTTEQQKKEKDK